MELNKIPLTIIAVALLVFNAFMVCRHYKPRCSECSRKATADLLVVEDPATGVKRCAPCLHRHLLSDLNIDEPTEKTFGGQSSD